MKPPPVVWKMAALLGAAIFLAACGGNGGGIAERSPSPAVAAVAGSAEAAVPARPPAPAFDLAVLGGGRFNLIEHRGEVVVFYSGSLCPT